MADRVHFHSVVVANMTQPHPLISKAKWGSLKRGTKYREPMFLASFIIGWNLILEDRGPISRVVLARSLASLVAASLLHRPRGLIIADVEATQLGNIIDHSTLLSSPLYIPRAAITHHGAGTGSRRPSVCHALPTIDIICLRCGACAPAFWPSFNMTVEGMDA